MKYIASRFRIFPINLFTTGQEKKIFNFLRDLVLHPPKILALYP